MRNEANSKKHIRNYTLAMNLTLSFKAIFVQVKPGELYNSGGEISASYHCKMEVTNVNFLPILELHEMAYSTRVCKK